MLKWTWRENEIRFYDGLIYRGCFAGWPLDRKKQAIIAEVVCWIYNYLKEKTDGTT